MPHPPGGSPANPTKTPTLIYQKEQTMETDQMKKKLKFIVTVTGAAGDEDCTINMKFDPPIKTDGAVWDENSGVAIMAALIIQAVEGARDED